MEPWLFIQNVFDNSTKINLLKMSLISTHHLNAIKRHSGDSFFDGLIAFYQPLDEAFQDLFSKWQSSIFAHKGATQSFDELLKDLMSKKAEAWDTAVKIVYPKRSAKYVSVMGDLHKRFQRGKKDERVDAVMTLAKNIGTDASLAALKIDVLDFHTLLTDARKLQQGKLTGTKDFSNDIEKARLNCANGMYANLGGLMQRFYLRRELIENYFDLLNIRNHHQTVFHQTVPAHSSKTILRHGFKTGDELTVVIPDDAEDLLFCLKHESGLSCSTGALAPKGAATNIKVDETMGNMDKDKFLTVTNTGEADAHFTMTVNF